jgi:hypothetical protein
MKYENLKEFIEIEVLKKMSYEDINKLLNKFNEENKQLEQQNKELLQALIEMVKWHQSIFQQSKICKFDCAGNEDCYECIHVQYTGYINLIEKATGKSWKEIINE